MAESTGALILKVYLKKWDVNASDIEDSISKI